MTQVITMGKTKHLNGKVNGNRYRTEFKIETKPKRVPLPEGLTGKMADKVNGINMKRVKNRVSSALQWALPRNDELMKRTNNLELKGDFSINLSFITRNSDLESRWMLYRLSLTLNGFGNVVFNNPATLPLQLIRLFRKHGTSLDNLGDIVVGLEKFSQITKKSMLREKPKNDSGYGHNVHNVNRRRIGGSREHN